MTVNTAFLAMD